MGIKGMRAPVNLTSSHQEVAIRLLATEKTVQALLSFTFRHLEMPVKLRNFF
jgi:hypothetical protein